MKKIREKINFQNSDKFTVLVYSKEPRTEYDTVVFVEVSGLMHPLLPYNLQNFCEEITKNPQLAEATSIIDTTLKTWLDRFPDNVHKAIAKNASDVSGSEEGPNYERYLFVLSNIGCNSKTAYITNKLGSAISKQVRERFPELVYMIKNKKPEIEEALKRGKKIALEDPSDSVRASFDEACNSITKHPNIATPRQTFQLHPPPPGFENN